MIVSEYGWGAILSVYAVIHPAVGTLLYIFSGKEEDEDLSQLFRHMTLGPVSLLLNLFRTKRKHQQRPPDSTWDIHGV